MSLAQLLQHVDHAVDGAGREAVAGPAQVGQRVEGAVQVARTVDQQQRFSCRSSRHCAARAGAARRGDPLRRIADAHDSLPALCCSSLRCALLACRPGRRRRLGAGRRRRAPAAALGAAGRPQPRPDDATVIEDDSVRDRGDRACAASRRASRCSPRPAAASGYEIIVPAAAAGPRRRTAARRASASGTCSTF